MRKILLVIVVLVILCCLFAGYFFYQLRHIDFMGKRDPEAVAASAKRMNDMLLTAEYRDGTDYCIVEVLDSAHVNVNVGDAAGGVILEAPYVLSGDTIVVPGGLKHAEKYLQGARFLIRGDKLLFRTDSAGRFDTTIAMLTRFNKLGDRREKGL